MNRTGPAHQHRRHVSLVVTAVAVVAVDLLSKVAASAYLDARGIDLPGPLDLRLAYNPGVAFSLANNVPTWLVLAFTGGVAATIVVVAWRGMFASAIAAGVIGGGAIANVIDRVQGGTVVDMLYTGWWPTFNLADVAVVCGGFALAITNWRAAPPGDQPAADRPSDLPATEP